MSRSRMRGRKSDTRAMAEALLGPHMMAFVPALALGAFWIAGEWALAAVALGVPVMFLITGSLRHSGPRRNSEVDPVTGLPMVQHLPQAADKLMSQCTQNRRNGALFLAQLEEFDGVMQRHGQEAANMLLERVAQRFTTLLREDDEVIWLGNARFAIVLASEANFELESAVQLAARLQSAAEEPVSANLQAVFVSCAIGFCLTRRAPKEEGRCLIGAAETALGEALRNAPSAVRSFSADMAEAAAAREELVKSAGGALARGEIVPWFQPQISTDTGRVTGFEALARWQHPERGLLSPAEFLPALADAGQMERLGEVILSAALAALKEWDLAGAEVPCVAVNFTAEELRNPKLAERLRWQLDRYELAPERLTIEVLETVVAGSPEDAAARNLSKLAKLGCRIDLDDFGTGHASITSIRRFAIERIKIDRSFVTRVDKDQEQQRMVSAIQTMAERLDLETLAEGVETASEHAMLAQLGCAHVQGYGIARPMPLDVAARWLETHTAGLAKLPQIKGGNA